MSKNYSGKLAEQDYSAANAATAQAAVRGTVDTENLDDTEGGPDGKGLPAVIKVEAENTVEPSGKVEKLIIHDEGEEELMTEEEVDIESNMVIRIRKPGRNEYFMVLWSSLFTTHLLCYKPDPESMNERILYVDRGLREKFTQDLRKIKFLLCFSCSSKRFFLWPMKISDTSWYHSLDAILRKPIEDFMGYAIRVSSNMDLQRYQVSRRLDSRSVVWPTRPMSDLVTEAIGPDNTIVSPDHPVYKELMSGEEVQ